MNFLISHIRKTSHKRRASFWHISSSPGCEILTEVTIKSTVSWVAMPASASFLLGLLFEPEDKGETLDFLWTTWCYTPEHHTLHYFLHNSHNCPFHNAEPKVPPYHYSVVQHTGVWWLMSTLPDLIPSHKHLILNGYGAMDVSCCGFGPHVFKWKPAH
jgi:hypothetical protein